MKKNLVKTMSVFLIVNCFFSMEVLGKVNRYIDTGKKNKPIVNYLKNIFNENINNMSTREYEWYTVNRSNEEPMEIKKEAITWIPKYDCYYIGDISKKNIYLTFDEGYENGYTGPILDVLKKQNVKASFFVTKHYVKTNPDLIRRMVEEGHLVCNHTATHPSMAQIKNQDKFNKEITDLEKAYEEVVGKPMPKYFRPPMGKYSELSLYYTKCIGYKTIFWSFAYYDWEPKRQPSPEAAMKQILKKTHNGGVFLLHAVSKTNANIMDSVITEWKKEGYEIKNLDEL